MANKRSEFSQLLEAITKLASIEDAACSVADQWVVAQRDCCLVDEYYYGLKQALDALERATSFCDIRKVRP